MTGPVRSRVVSVLGRLVFVFSLFGISACLISRTWAGVLAYVVFAAVAAAVVLREKHRAVADADSRAGSGGEH